MMRRLRSNPRDERALVTAVSIGVVLLLAGILYLSLTANRGLPWERSTALTIELPDAQRIAATDTVRIRGVRVGRVASVSAVPGSGTQHAYVRVQLALEHGAGALPTDTTARIRPASVLGASYVDLTPGSSTQTLAPGAVLDQRTSPRAVELTDLFETFDHATARDIRTALGGMAAGIAGRGADLNTTFAGLSRMLGPLAHVMGNLAAPQTGMARFVGAADRFSRELSPVAGALAELMRDGATTFEALNARRGALGDDIETFPGAAAAATTALDRLRHPLTGLATLATDLEPGARELPVMFGRLNAALAAGVSPLGKVPAFSDRLRTLLATLTRVTRMSTTDSTVRKLSDLVSASADVLAVLTPAQTQCNVIASWAQYFGNANGTLGLADGPAFVNLATTSIGSRGETLQAKEPSPNIGINYLPNENADECESGNEHHDGVSQRLSNPPGNQSKAHPITSPPPGVRELAAKAGLLTPPGGTR